MNVISMLEGNSLAYYNSIIGQIRYHTAMHGIHALTATNSLSRSINSSSYLTISNPDTSFRIKKSIDKFHDYFSQLSTNEATSIVNELFIKPFPMLNSSFLEFLINDKIKLSRKLHLILNILTQPNNTLSERHSNVETNELISKNTAKALRKSLKTKRKKNSTTPLTNVIGRCFEPYGCFRISEPFRTIYRPINLIPEPPNAIKVAFYLRTRSNPTLPERLVYNENSEYLSSKYFRSESDLKMIVHGYLESSDEFWVNEMSMALLNRADLNVICVDWMLGASPPYSQAVANTRLVGAMIAHLIQIIKKSHPNGFASSKIHIIGHSLGAHIAGYTGEIIRDLGQITGLDPAEPYFQYTDPIVRLDPNDARFVDVIHSDVASIMSGGFGMSQPCGHVDFYPNGGVDQPGCKQTSIKNVMDYISKEKNIFDGIRRFIGCNHARSFLIYIEAINSECPFMAFPCNSYDEFVNGQCTSTLIDSPYYEECFQDQQPNAIMMNLTCPIRLGMDSQHDFTRVKMENKTLNQQSSSKVAYFLQTNDKPPYCHYHYNVKLLFHFQKNRFHSSFRTLRRTYFDWPFNGKLHLGLVGSRNRIQTETLFKPEHFKETIINKKFDELCEYNLMVNAADLGKLLRIELDWRYSGQIQRSLATMQTKTFKKLFSQLSSLESSAAPLLTSFLNEIHRSGTLNVNQSQQQLNVYKYWPSMSIMSNEMILKTFDHNQPSSLQNNEIISTFLKQQQQQQDHNPTIPMLRAVIIKKLETNQQTLFCANENDVQEIFQLKNRQPKTITLLASMESFNDHPKSNTSTFDSTMSYFCHTNH